MEIIEQLQSGDNRYLEEIFRMHSSYCIKNLQIKYRCQPEEAEDIFIDAVINFRQKAVQGDISYLTSIRNYLFATCCNMWKASRYQKNSFMRKVPEIKRYFYQEYQEDITAREQDEYIDDLLRITNEAMESLGDKCQRILRYYYFDRYSMAEIAEKMEFSGPDVAKTLKSRCFKRLINRIKELQSKQKR